MNPRKGERKLQFTRKTTPKIRATPNPVSPLEPPKKKQKEERYTAQEGGP